MSAGPDPAFTQSDDGVLHDQPAFDYCAPNAPLIFAGQRGVCKIIARRERQREREEDRAVFGELDTIMRARPPSWMKDRGYCSDWELLKDASRIAACNEIEQREAAARDVGRAFRGGSHAPPIR